MIDTDRFRRADALFRQAVGLPEAQRDPFVRSAAAGDSGLIAEVRELLAADALASGILDRPAFGGGISAASIEACIAAPDVPARIGRYRITGILGEGGMGLVYEAEQDNPRRRVAIKVLRPGSATPALLRRFHLEAHILGRLQHAGIAQILEAGSVESDGAPRPYFAMEYVQGRTLPDFCADHALDARARLALMADVCDIAHYAHQSGVVHRDLKPSNILVLPGLHPGAPPRPKVLDFGVARIVEPDTQPTQQTTIGELIGTALYMSPEQAAGDPAGIDWRTDVYALGVITFELLTGRHPHNTQGVPVHEVLRAIAQDECTTAGNIDRALRGEVETILAKALSRDRQSRYQSAAEFAADIRRHLNDEPITARPPTAMYQIRKFARRNRPLVAGFGIAIAALLIGSAAAIRQAISAERARREESRLRGIADDRAAEAERQAYRANLVAAAAALRHHGVLEAATHLEAAPEALRGWEWSHLSAQLDQSTRQFSVVHTPTAAARSPDGRRFISCSSGGKISLRDIDTGAVLATHTLVGSVQERRILRLVYAPDGRTIRAEMQHGAVVLDALSLAPVEASSMIAVERSPDGALGAVSMETADLAYLALRETAGERRDLFRLPMQFRLIPVVEFSPDGSILAAYRGEGFGFSMHRIPDGAELAAHPELNGITDIAISRDGASAALATSGGSTYILSVPDGTILARLDGHAGAVTGVDVAPDGERLATIATDGAVRIWDVATGELRTAMHGARAPFRGLEFTHDGRQVITWSSNGDVLFWDAERTRDHCVIQMPGSVYSVAFSRDGALLAAASLMGEDPLRVWSTADGRPVFAGLGGHLSALAFDDPTERIIVGRAHGPITVIDLASSSEVLNIPGHHWRTDWVAFSGDGRECLSIGNSGRLSRSDLATGSGVRVAALADNSEGEGCRAALSPDGSLIAVASRNVIELRSLSGPETVSRLDGHTRDVYALAFSADGSRLVSGDRDGLLRVWDVNRRTPVATLRGHTDGIFAAVFSPDGSRLFSGGRDRVVRVWDTRTYSEITQLHGHTSFIYCMAFSPDGRTLITGSGDATLRIWSVDEAGRSPWSNTAAR